MTNEMTITHFIQFLQDTDIYRAIKYDFVNYPEYEKLNGSVIMPAVFDRLVDRLGRIPTQREFVEEGLLDSAKFFLNPQKLKNGNERWLKVYNDKGYKVWHNFSWTERLQKAIVSRLARSYHSMTAEHTAELTLKYLFPDWTIISDERLDRVLGTDIVCITDDNQVVYFHVTAESNYALHLLKRKARYDGKLYKGGKPIYFKRNFNAAHKLLLYSRKLENNKSMHHASIIFFKKTYIENTALSALEDAEELQDSQLVKFNDWLIANGQRGIKELEEMVVC